MNSKTRRVTVVGGNDGLIDRFKTAKPLGFPGTIAHGIPSATARVLRN